MRYENPVLRGMYPDPSVCRAGEKYYMVCSTFQYFPAVPLFESEDMVNWKQLGHCITRKSQLDLTGANIFSGIFAPTIRYNDGRFYMVTTNSTNGRNFYVYTDDIYGEWSEPVTVEQDGIDPSLYFEDGRSYFISNGYDEESGRSCIRMCEIDITTGKKLSGTRPLWYGTGGRFIEAPHLYKFGDYYYILDAEGGTEYGHMVNYARGESMWGPFTPYPGNPVLTNRNLGGYTIQGAGHGDVIEDKDGKWWFMHLAFRQSGQWLTYHHLGRESCLVPVEWKDGWFTMGDGTCQMSYDLPDRTAAPQKLTFHDTFESLPRHAWSFIRNYKEFNYEFNKSSLYLVGTKDDLFTGELPTFTGLRQREMKETFAVSVRSNCTEAGITVYLNENHHYDLYTDVEGRVHLRLTIGCLSAETASVSAQEDTVRLIVEAEPETYHFYAECGGVRTKLGIGETRYLSSEVAGGFTGVMFGLYAVDAAHCAARFSELDVSHED